MTTLPAHAIAHALGDVPGVVAVMLGGSRARGDHSDASDHDIGIYYRPPLDIDALSALARALAGPGASVTRPGAWGPWVDGGGWLSIGGLAVDWLYRDLDRVRASWDSARRGEVEFHAQVGHPFGVPSFGYAGEVALGVVLHDPTGELTELHDVARHYPPALGDALVAGLGEADFLVAGLRKSMPRVDAVWLAGNAFRIAMLCVHALHGRAGRWLINEKGAVESAGGLSTTPPGFVALARSITGSIGSEAGDHVDSVAACERLISMTRAACG